jgi:hypothetical protein
VPRLGLNWKVSDELTVKGGLYFALTPSVIMAGGSLSATWQSGGIRAWFDAQTDFLIRYKPFHYEISVAIAIGVSVTVDLLVTSVTIVVHVGVGLKITGPPFGGTATIDLSIVSFTLSLGDTSPLPEEIKWPEFRDSFLPPAISRPSSQFPPDCEGRRQPGWYPRPNGLPAVRPSAPQERQVHCYSHPKSVGARARPNF